MSLQDKENYLKPQFCDVQFQSLFCTVIHKGSTEIFLTVQKYFLLTVQKCLLQHKNIYHSTNMFVTVQE